MFIMVFSSLSNSFGGATPAILVKPNQRQPCIGISAFFEWFEESIFSNIMANGYFSDNVMNFRLEQPEK